MSKTTKGFIYAGLIYLALGAILGSLFLFLPDLKALRTVHAHMNLVGFVVFVIFGVAYHILPRFSGKPLVSEGWAWGQFLLANVALAALLVFMSIGAFARVPGLMVLQGMAGALLAISFLLFVTLMMTTLLRKAPE